jgi:hypothetical protein
MLQMHPKSQDYVLQICCLEGGQFRKEHSEIAVDLNNTNILDFVIKLLHFATDGAIYISSIGYFVWTVQ